MNYANPLRCKDCKTRKADVEYSERYRRQLCLLCVGRAGRAEREMTESLKETSEAWMKEVQ